MTMTLHLTDDEVAALAAQAETEGRTAEDVAAEVVREHLARREHHAVVDATARREAARYAETLRELADK